MFLETSKGRIVFDDTNSQEKQDLVTKKLFEFNQSQSKKVVECDEIRTKSPIFIEVYAVEAELIGGLISYIDWGRWLYIDTVWVDADYRKQGIGQYLMKFAEQKGRDRGIKRARLCTFDFQALSFYKKLGYTIYGELEDFPEGHTLYYLKKLLS